MLADTYFVNVICNMCSLYFSNIITFFFPEKKLK